MSGEGRRRAKPVTNNVIERRRLSATKLTGTYSVVLA